MFYFLPRFFRPFAPRGLFGPSNFEDCVLDGVKNAISNQAANAIMLACRGKFPLPPTPLPPTFDPRQFVEETPEFHVFDASENSPAVTALISKIEVNRIGVASHGQDYGYGMKSSDFGYHLSVEVTNRNDFSIDLLKIGLPKRAGKCSWSDADYAELFQCRGKVSSGISGLFRCDIPRLRERKIFLCVTGFGVYGTRTFADDFMTRKNIPKLAK
ncbi:hypothetical protein LP414_00235 [Polaromonas sp. P1(28)-13]|nr:hypothetical protein LP414_00235 [Polaromonas sp. P1(28)-13]